MNQVAVVVVDAQRDFLDPTTEPGVGSWAKAFCVPGAEQLLACARVRGWQVVHVGTRHATRDTLPLHHRAQELKLYCAEGSAGADLVVSPQDDEVVLYKHWYSAFDAELADVLEDGTRIVWAGVATDCCIQQSAFEADRRGIQSIVPYQAVSASSPAAYIGSLVGMAKSACDIVDLSDLLADPNPSALEVEDIESRASGWYRDCTERLGEATSLTLEAALERLAT